MKLPPKVHKKGKSLYYVHKNKWTRLCDATATEEVLHGEIWKILKKGADTLEKVITDYRADSLRFGFGLYHDEDDVERLCEVLAQTLD